VLPAVPTGCKINRLYNIPACNPVIVCGLVVEDNVPVAVLVPVNVYVYDVMLTPEGKVGGVQLIVALVESIGTRSTFVGGAMPRVWVILEEFWEVLKTVESVVAEPLYEYRVVFITIV